MRAPAAAHRCFPDQCPADVALVSWAPLSSTGCQLHSLRPRGPSCCILHAVAAATAAAAAAPPSQRGGNSGPHMSGTPPGRPAHRQAAWRAGQKHIRGAQSSKTGLHPPAGGRPAQRWRSSCTWAPRSATYRRWPGGRGGGGRREKDGRRGWTIGVPGAGDCLPPLARPRCRRRCGHPPQQPPAHAHQQPPQSTHRCTTSTHDSTHRQHPPCQTAPRC